MKKQTNDIAEETEVVIQDLISDFRKQMKLNCGAKRHYYSMFNVERSMFDVQSGQYATFTYRHD